MLSVLSDNNIMPLKKKNSPAQLLAVHGQTQPALQLSSPLRFRGALPDCPDALWHIALGGDVFYLPLLKCALWPSGPFGMEMA